MSGVVSYLVVVQATPIHTMLPCCGNPGWRTHGSMCLAGRAWSGRPLS